MQGTMGKIKVWLTESIADDILIGEAESYPQACRLMHDYVVNTLHYKIYYTRMSMIGDKTLWLDFGSHVKFIVMEGVTWNEVTGQSYPSG